MTTEQVRERVLELVSSVELQARRTRSALQARSIEFAGDMASVTVSLATELAELLGRGELEVEERIGGES